ncbi:CsgE family curli-type amyloid fiber assembly protein [Spiribacter insolitus]|uniref:Curli production assembly/transport component CsgE n=1 Tax=Spiribacter insolitus TaxID=3122417 RepID=A0ABV3T3Y1_9GAMM
MTGHRHHRGWAGIALIVLALAGMHVVAEDQANGTIDDGRPLEAPPLPDGTLENDGLDNMVLQRTVTALGDRFSDAFASHWRSQPVVADGVITIEERPWMSEGTEVIVRYQRQAIYQVRVWPRNPSPEETAQQAVAEVSRIIDDYQTRLRNQTGE